MRFVIRTFFRGIRMILTPIMLLMERFTTPKPILRTPAQNVALNQAAGQLALYQFRACPFCIKVRKELARLGLSIDTRDAQHDAKHRSALQAEGGRIKVPCLRVRHEDGQEEWMYESDAINTWLRARFEHLPE